jgi:hypothetical protein
MEIHKPKVKTLRPSQYDAAVDINLSFNTVCMLLPDDVEPVSFYNEYVRTVQRARRYARRYAMFFHETDIPGTEQKIMVYTTPMSYVCTLVLDKDEYNKGTLMSHWIAKTKGREIQQAVHKLFGTRARCVECDSWDCKYDTCPYALEADVFKHSNHKAR